MPCNPFACTDGSTDGVHLRIATKNAPVSWETGFRCHNCSAPAAEIPLLCKPLALTIPTQSSPLKTELLPNNIYVHTYQWPLLWPSGQSSWLQFIVSTHKMDTITWKKRLVARLPPATYATVQHVKTVQFIARFQKCNLTFTLLLRVKR
jgi:hypothetical protein